MPGPILEVIALSAADARAAQAGGADRLELVTDMDSAGLTPSVRTFTEVSSAVEIPVRVMLRDAPGFAPHDLPALAVAARALRRAGAREFVLGFLTPSGDVDLPAVHIVLDAIDGAPWTFHRAIDHTRDRTSAWSAVAGLPGLDQVLTAGSPTGLTTRSARLPGSSPSGTTRARSAETPRSTPSGTTGARSAGPPTSLSSGVTTPPAGDFAVLPHSGTATSALPGALAPAALDGLATLVAEAADGHAGRILAGGSLQQHHIVPLLAAGVRAFHTGSGVRIGGSWAAPVDPELVHAWRSHLHS